MLPLDDPRWVSYRGGYQVVYDATTALRRLIEGPGEGLEEALDELEEELCHQGDLGAASYAAVPWLVESLRRAERLDARVVGLVLTIEFARPFQRAAIPDELRAGYEEALRRLPDVVWSRRGGAWDERLVQLAAAVVALAAGDRWWARAYYELDRATLEPMIAQEFGSAEWDWP
jgi:hypothetical protein